MKEYKWIDLCIKDKIQYIVAVVLVVSGIVMAFLSFFLNQYDIATGTLIYIAQCFITAGGIFGISIYFKSKLGEFKSDTMKRVEDIVERITSKDDTDTGEKV